MESGEIMLMPVDPRRLTDLQLASYTRKMQNAFDATLGKPGDLHVYFNKLFRLRLMKLEAEHAERESWRAKNVR